MDLSPTFCAVLLGKTSSLKKCASHVGSLPGSSGHALSEHAAALTQGDRLPCNRSAGNFPCYDLGSDFLTEDGFGEGHGCHCSGCRYGGFFLSEHLVCDSG